jgi:hypothetical protein
MSTRVDAHPTLGERALVFGLEGCDICVVLNQTDNFIVGGGIGGLKRDIATKTTWVVAKTIGLWVLREAAAWELEHSLEWSHIDLEATED